MSDDDTADADSAHDEHADNAHDEHADDDHAESGETRQTSPMQPYGSREVTLGAIILAVGLLLTFGLAVGLV